VASIAAGISLVNVVITSRLSRRSQVDHWRRDVERPLAAGLIQVSVTCVDHWESAIDVLKEFIAARSASPKDVASVSERYAAAVTAWNEGVSKHAELEFKWAELALVADKKVRDAATELRSKHRLLVASAEPPDDVDRIFKGDSDADLDFIKLHGSLINAVRVDLGVDHDRRVLTYIWKAWSSRFGRRAGEGTKQP